VTDLLVAVALGAALAAPQTVPTEPSPDALTIEEAVRIGLENAYPVRLAEIAEDRARANRRTVASAGGFNINFQGQFFWFDGTGGLSTGSIGTGGTRQTGGNTGGGSAPNTFNSLQVSFNQPIDISGAQRANVRAADWFVVAAEEQTTAATNQTKGEIRAAFLQALAAQELVVVQQTRLANATERRDTTNAAYLIGERPRFDLLRTENEVQQAQKGVLDAANAFEIAKQALNNAMGRPIETPVSLVPPTDDLNAVADNDTLVQRAIQRRAELDAFAARILGLEALEGVSRTLYRPSLNLSAQHSRVVDAPPGQDQSTLAGVILSIPLADSGRSRAAVDTAEANTLEAELQRQQLELAIALAVRSARTNLVNAVTGLTLAQSSVELAAEAYRLAKLLYDEGQGPLLDVITAQNDLTSAQAGFVAAVYEVRRARAALQQAVGDDDLSEEVGE